MFQIAGQTLTLHWFASVGNLTCFVAWSKAFQRTFDILSMEQDVNQGHSVIKTSLQCVLRDGQEWFMDEMEQLAKKMQRLRIRVTHFIHWYMIRHENPPPLSVSSILGILVFMNGHKVNQTTSTVDWRIELARLQEDLLMFNSLTGALNAEQQVELYMEQLFPNATGTTRLTIGLLREQIKSAAMKFINSGTFGGHSTNPAILRRRELTMELVEQFYISNSLLQRPILHSTELFVYESTKIYANLVTNVKLHFVKFLKKYLQKLM